jgi:hypothetical protein
VGGSAGCAPEPFLRSVWGLLSQHALDASTYEFCREVGRLVLGHHRSDPDWDLTWMRGEATPSQACWRYWTIGVKPVLWDAELERQTMGLLKEYSFQF